MKGSDSAKAYNNLGCVYLAQGEYRKAAQSFNKAIELSPKFYTKANENLKKVEMGWHQVIEERLPLPQGGRDEGELEAAVLCVA